MMSRFLSTKKLLIVLIIGDLIAIGGYVFGLNYLLGLNEQISVLAAQVSSYSATNENLSSLQAALNKAEEGMKEIDEYYIAPDGTVDLISIVESIAKSRGLSISVGSVDSSDVDKATKDFQEKLVLRLKTEGSWAATEQFLQLVDNLTYNVHIDAADLTKLDPQLGLPGTKQGPVRWKGEFQLTALKLK